MSDKEINNDKFYSYPNGFLTRKQAKLMWLFLQRKTIYPYMIMRFYRKYEILPIRDNKLFSHFNLPYD